MENLTFTKNSDGLYEATLSGFTGTLQIDREAVGHVVIYARMASDMRECVLLNDKGNATLVHLELSSSVLLRITSTTNVTKAVYTTD